MDQAKSAMKDFLSKSGQHDTTVHEKVAPGVTHETINREHHENVQTAIDKEVHQDHYHTSVQPVKDREVLPEQHHHNIGAVEHRQFEHGNDKDVAQRLQAESAQFRDQRIEGTERHTKSIAPTLAGEHVHHHVHETIQPVVQKETIEPHVTHTTVPIHEVHHNAAQHHAASALPAVSMAEFKQQGGVLSGREERYDGFQGEPKTIGGTSSTSTSGTGLTGTGASTSTTGRGVTGTGATTGASTATGTGLAGTGASSKLTPGSDLTGTTGASKDGSGKFGTMDDSTRGSSTGNSNSSTNKASLMDKLNPKKDADGDGKAGFMS